MDQSKLEEALKKSKKEATDKDLTKDLKLDHADLNALLRRAKCYANIGEWEQAVQDYEKAFKIECSQEIYRFLEDAKRELERSLRRDYYVVLGLDKKATFDDIHMAFGKFVKDFQDVQEAYQILSDPQSRLKYDNEVRYGRQSKEDMDKLLRP